jgi:15-cis-phytoene synthase
MIARTGLPPLRDDIRALALNYVREPARDVVHALWALDEALGQIVRTTTQPMIGQMRLTWWHERLSAIGEGEPPAEPILATLTETGLAGPAMAGIVEGWEALLDPLPWSDTVIADHAVRRGGALFALSAQLLDNGNDVTAAGEGWAAMDVALHCSDRDTALRARQLALARLANACVPDAKPLRILTHIATRDAQRTFGKARPRFDLMRAVIF